MTSGDNERYPKWHVLGAGLAGLAAAIELGADCTLFEAENRAGGLVRTKIVDVPGIGRFWFDLVLHLLYFPDEATAERVKSIAGPALVPCVPIAYVETDRGTTRYPLQMHLAGLSADARIRCLTDLAKSLRSNNPPPANFEEALVQTFGKAMCELFLLPYNRKAWGRPLRSLRGTLGWTVTRPDFEQVVRGAISENPHFSAYNVDGWYPRPARGSAVRGMEYLSQRLAEHVRDLKTGHRLIQIDPVRRTMVIESVEGRRTTSYRNCIATLPLPRLIALCEAVPPRLARDVARLSHNRVRTVALCLRGPVPQSSGHWRYYGDEGLCFTRLIFMHAFDPDSAPPGCWGLMAEIPEPAERPPSTDAAMIERVLADVRRIGAIDAEQDVLAAHAWTIDPAYVVFTDETEQIVAETSEWLAAQDIHLLGRYGRWEYSSMAQVMRDGFALAAELNAGA